MSAVAEKLRAARKLIERGWTQRAVARTAAGDQTGAFDPSAVCFCSLGAIAAAYGPTLPDYTRTLEFVERLPEIQGNIVTFNDAPERTQSEVLAAFDRAIEIAESGK